MRSESCHGKKHGERGMTLIELMLAMLMLAAGLIGVLALLMTAISGNSRNKMDSAGTMLAQMVTDQIVAKPPAPGAPFNVTDCDPDGATNWQIQTAPGGANLDATSGNINWTDTYDSVPDGYKMHYVSCGANGQQITYELRWRVQAVNGFSKMVTVGARPLGAQNQNGGWLNIFARPVTLRTIIAS